ncbi:MAG: exodeoxyribonuclease VII small subunit [Haliscomenobacter sp.]|uniref:Exodeoxyribonuclease VII small subunit n=1 Tax=Haliscomenobacter hydrossis (strain ATCC 27775 / DSM 1100 / LMG 10767 / O) TaxID=760192 RepID=F4L3H3_HALH1|nr:MULTISPECIES: exodeoxyribonuclease VII small subunit [Haliscomenobacter]AEE52950.1 Exonuclease VII small subunit [Haliscomenobacter hydrossis DSM 1100]MBK9490931.1 exodeoxyribonuclease VII small subunit [Haliscomenobacter sp.]HPH17560.1 exodeoxyribonuclease VII small subunit [Haliscomenobacter sp.]
MELTYEKAMQELQTITQDLQEGKIGIDELAAQLQRAAELIRFCREKLRNVEKEIEGLFEE